MRSKVDPVLLPLFFHLGQPLSLESWIIHVERRVDHDFHGCDAAQAADGLALGNDLEATALVSDPELFAFQRLVDEGEDLAAELGDGDFHEPIVAHMYA